MERYSVNTETGLTKEGGFHMKRVIRIICLLVCFLAMSGCGSSADSTENSEDAIIRTYEKSDEDGRVHTYYELSDGRWKTGDCYYQDRVILSGRFHNAKSDVVLVCLSNLDDITFSDLEDDFFSSDSRKHYSVEEVALVEMYYEEANLPTPTACPNVNVPTLWMNGKLYWVELIEEKNAEFDEEDFVGTVESKVSETELPTKEMESNTLPAGTSIYKHRELEDVYVAIYRRSGLVYYYRIFDNGKV